MSIFDVINPLYSLSGFGVGLLVGLTGVGGGSLMTPVLILLFGIHPATAVGTDLLYAAITKCGGTIVHGRHKNVDWRLTARLAAGSVPAAIAKEIEPLAKRVADLGWHVQINIEAGPILELEDLWNRLPKTRRSITSFA